MKVLVCGARSIYQDQYNAVLAFLDGFQAALVWAQESGALLASGAALEPITDLVHGAAIGDSVDRAAGWWATTRLGPAHVHPYPAHWRHGPKCPAGCSQVTGRPAGPIRNQQMLNQEKPDVAIAFPGEVGAADMVTRAEKVDCPVVRASFGGGEA